MDIAKVKEFLKERRELHESQREEAEWIMDDYYDRITDFIIADIHGAIEFMTQSPECTDEIFTDWSEVFDDVVRKSQSKAFVDALPVAAKRFPAACKKYNIDYSIEYARGELL